ncbi:hypothetical protein Tco_1362953 [Tanacetum coccineum]
MLESLIRHQLQELYNKTVSLKGVIVRCVVSMTISTATLPPHDTTEAFSTTINQDAPSPSTTPTTKTTTLIQSTNVEEPNNEDKDAKFDSDTFTNPSAPPLTSSDESSSRIVDTSNIHTF